MLINDNRIHSKNPISMKHFKTYTTNLLLILIVLLTSTSCEGQKIDLNAEETYVHELEFHTAYLINEIDKLQSEDGDKEKIMEMKKLYNSLNNALQEDLAEFVLPKPKPKPCPPANCLLMNTKFILSAQKLKELKVSILNNEGKVLGESISKPLEPKKGLMAFPLEMKEDWGDNGTIVINKIDMDGNPFEYKLDVEFQKL